MAIRYTVNPNACAECGHVCDEVGEFHPHMFCVLKQAGVRDPWKEFAWCVERLGGQPMPDKPPLVRHLPNV